MDTIRRSRGMRISVAPAMFILGFILLSAWNCYAESGIATLFGEYAFVGTSSCLEVKNQQDFLPDFEVPSAGATLRTGHYQGILRLHGNGTGTWEYYFAEYSPEFIVPTRNPFGTFKTVEPCDVIYEQRPNRVVLTILEGCLSVMVAGRAVGRQTETGEMPLTLLSSMNGDTLLLSKTHPVIEEVIRNTATGLVTKRECSRTFTAVRVDARR